MSPLAATTKGAVTTVATQELRQLVDSKRSFQFWNVPTDEWFQGENIAGSRRVPLDRVGSEVRGTNLPKNTEIVVYCGGPSVHRATWRRRSWPSLATKTFALTRVGWKSGKVRASR
jgi:hypothetical protein